MILKVVLTKSIAGSGRIQYVTVIYESGTRIKYRPGKIPKTVERFMSEHVEQTKKVNDTWIQKTYIYDQIKKGKQHV